MPQRKSLGRKPLFLLLCTGLVSASLLPAMPDTPPMRLTFGLDQRFTLGRNEGLEVPSEGRSAYATTGLNFGFISETPLDRLQFSGNTRLRLGDRGDESVSEFEEPRLLFSYVREGVDSNFDLRGNYRRSRVEFSRTLDDFLNEDGEIDLPDGFEDFTGTGQRTDYGASTRLVLGREAAPFGVTLEASIRGVDYDEEARTQFSEERRTRVAANFRFRLSPVVTARLDLSHSRFDEDDDPVNPTRRRTDRVQTGFVYALSAVTQLDVGLGWTRIDRRDEGTTTEGLNATFDLGRELPDGSIGLALDVDQTVDGQRGSLVVRRALVLPDGSLSGRIGASRLAESGDVGLIGGLDWTKALPTGRILLRVDRRLTGDEERRYRTLVSGSYTHDFTDISSISLRADYIQSSRTEDRNEVRQSNVGITYSHRLTPDWSLNAGASYRVREEDGRERATSPSVFIGLGRQFEFPL
jgi:hypothetical protein